MQWVNGPWMINWEVCSSGRTILFKVEPWGQCLQGRMCWNVPLDREWEVPAQQFSLHGEHSCKQPLGGSASPGCARGASGVAQLERLLHVFCQSQRAAWFSLSCAVVHFWYKTTISDIKSHQTGPEQLPSVAGEANVLS